MVSFPMYGHIFRYLFVSVGKVHIEVLLVCFVLLQYQNFVGKPQDDPEHQDYIPTVMPLCYRKQVTQWELEQSECRHWRVEQKQWQWKSKKSMWKKNPSIHDWKLPIVWLNCPSSSTLVMFQHKQHLYLPLTKTFKHHLSMCSMIRNSNSN